MQDKGWGGVERRQFKRAPLSFIITFHIYEPTRVRIMAGGEQYYGMMMDISEHGIAIKTKCDIPVKTSILIRMVLVNLSVRNPSKQLQESEAMGQVRNNVLIDNKLRRLGIQFVRIKEKDRAIIRNFVSKATK